MMMKRNWSSVERDKLLMRRMVSWMMWGVLILLIGVVLSVVNKELNFAHLRPD